jgi:hypothetical protein
MGNEASRGRWHGGGIGGILEILHLGHKIRGHCGPLVAYNCKFAG